MTRTKKPTRGGSKPRISDVAATARIELVVPPEVKERWLAATVTLGVSLSDMIRSSVDARIAEGGDKIDQIGRRVAEMLRDALSEGP